ncbi:hypothetical protein, partial [Xanthomonas perforans]
PVLHRAMQDWATRVIHTAHDPATQHWLRAIETQVAQKNAMTHVAFDNAVICYVPLASLAMHITQRSHHHLPLSKRS